MADIRNIAFCGHGSSGKTTLLDKLLVKTHAVGGHPSVDDGSSVFDFDPEEKHHRHTIEAAVGHFDHAKLRFQVIDTPGYPDFIGQTIGAMRAVETAVIVLNAHAGIEVNSRRAFQEATRAGLGKVIVINKLDDENANFEKMVASIRELWGNGCVPFDVPIGIGAHFEGVASVLNPSASGGAVVDPAAYRDNLVESTIEVDEEVMEAYFEGNVPSDDDLKKLIPRAVAAGTLVPIFCCAAKKEIGLDGLLDGLALCAVPPDGVERKGKNAAGEESVIHPDPAGPLVAQVFRTRIDPFVQKLSFLRIYSGTLKKDQHVETSDSRKGIKLHVLLDVQGGETHPVDEVGPGGIVAIAKMDDLHTGTSVGALVMPRIPFPTPMVGLAVLPKNRGDETKLANSLHKVVEEEPTFRLDRDAQTKELVMTGMSELHLNSIRERLARRDKLEIETKEPKIPYRETIQQPAEGMYRHRKQTGGRGQFGEVHIRMRPLPRGTDLTKFVNKENFPSHKEHHYDAENNFLWVDSVVGGVIPGNFMPAIEKGFKERIQRGVIAGYQVQDVCVEVYFGKHHDVDSSEAAFKTAGSMAFRNVFQQAKPSLLEPIVKLSITIPEGNVGDVYSDMSGRRGRVLGSDSAGGNLQTVHAEVPLAEITTYARSLSSMTGGQGSYSMEFSHYDVVPPNVQQEIISKAQLKEEEE